MPPDLVPSSFRCARCPDDKRSVFTHTPALKAKHFYLFLLSSVLMRPAIGQFAEHRSVGPYDEGKRLVLGPFDCLLMQPIQLLA